MALNRVKLGRIVTFMKCLASVISFNISSQKFFFWNKTTHQMQFPASNSLYLAVLVVNKLTKSICKKNSIIPLSIPFINAYCKDFKS